MSNEHYDNSSTHAQDTFRQSQKKEGWEREVLEKLAFASLREQRAQRRWNIFFRLATLSIVLFAIWLAMDLGSSDKSAVTSHTALIEIDGTIESGGRSAADAIIPALNNAYAEKGAVGVILHINSPGGSPVQAGIINDEIARLRIAYPQKPLYVVVGEMCASGGYYVAAAADKVFVNKASIVGSIGVLMDGFGATGLMEKIGVERRLVTAGDNKAFMDPFSPQAPKHKEYAQALVNEIHQQFIDVVRTGRGKRLKETPDMFSGLFWSGSKAVELGLADGFGTVESVARDELKAENIVDYTQHEGLPERVLKKFGAEVGAAAVKTMWGSAAAPSLK
jgi:protease-4